MYTRSTISGTCSTRFHSFYNFPFNNEECIKFVHAKSHIFRYSAQDSISIYLSIYLSLYIHTHTHTPHIVYIYIYIYILCSQSSSPLWIMSQPTKAEPRLYSTKLSRISFIVSSIRQFVVYNTTQSFLFFVFFFDSISIFVCYLIPKQPLQNKSDTI